MNENNDRNGRSYAEAGAQFGIQCRPILKVNIYFKIYFILWM